LLHLFRDGRTYLFYRSATSATYTLQNALLDKLSRKQREQICTNLNVVRVRHYKLYRPSHHPVLWGGRWPTGLPTYSCSIHTWCTVSSCRLSSGPKEVAAPSQAFQSIKPQDNARHTVEQSERHRAELH
jgi:hypothetical protein